MARFSGCRKWKFAANSTKSSPLPKLSDFIDTSVKHYSSGMYVRLAFSVAAHLEPEILVVDEVLAVGDMAFQKKSLGRMKHVAGEGRTVLFVSHDLSAISTLCETATVLTDGQSSPKEPVNRAIARYRSQLEVSSSGSLDSWRNRHGTGQAKITEFRIAGPGAVNGQVPLDTPATIEFNVDFYEPVPNPSFGILVHDALGEVLLDLRSSNCGANLVGTYLGKARVSATIPRLGLLPGHYVISIWVNNERETVDIDFVRTCGSFQVFDPGATTRKGRLNRSGAKFWTASEWTVCRQGPGLSQC